MTRFVHFARRLEGGAKVNCSVEMPWACLAQAAIFCCCDGSSSTGIPSLKSMPLSRSAMRSTPRIRRHRFSACCTSLKARPRKVERERQFLERVVRWRTVAKVDSTAWCVVLTDQHRERLAHIAGGNALQIQPRQRRCNRLGATNIGRHQSGAELHPSPERSLTLGTRTSTGPTAVSISRAGR